MVVAKEHTHTNLAKVTVDQALRENIHMDVVVEARGLVGFKDRSPARQLTLDDIMKDRRKEYYGEGQEWFCMKRQNRDVYSIIGAVTLPGSDKIYCLPVPEEEMNAR